MVLTNIQQFIKKKNSNKKQLIVGNKKFVIV